MGAPESEHGADASRRAVDHPDGPLLLTGPAGSGRSEALARRLAALAAGGLRPERVLTLTRSRAARARLARRADELLDRPHEELWVMTYEEAAERLLREHSIEAGIDPFFTTVASADRLAIMLDRLEDLPLRRHEIRGNPAGLLARLLARIDVLKAEAVGPEALREWAAAAERAARDAGERERAEREIEFAELYARHDRILRDAGSLDAGGLVLELVRLLRARPDVAQSLAERFVALQVDELEDAGRAHATLIERLAPHGNVVAACDPAQAVRRFRGAGEAAVERFRRSHPGCLELELPGPGRSPEKRGFWRCANERAQAQAVAREVEGLLAAGALRPEQVCVVAGSGWRESRLIAAAFEERSVPFRFAGDAAFFARPEVRDAIAWLRALADPSDAAAVVRALTRPPVELRSVDLAKVTTIARRRKLDMVSALEAALESPQLPPEARDRIQSFLRLHRAASRALEAMRADVFVRRLIERIGLRRHRLFAASPETAERLVNLSRLAELANAFTRREPRGSVRDFVRHLSAVADAGELGADLEGPAPGSVLLAEPAQVKGLEFEVVFVCGLRSGAIEAAASEDLWIPQELLAEELPAPGAELVKRRRRILAHVAMSRAARTLILSWPEAQGEGDSVPSRIFERAREAAGAEVELHAEELFGPAEGLHSTYRMLRDEVLEASWRAGAAVSEMRLDTAHDVDSAVARFLELIKVGALIQRPGPEPAAEALAAVNELLRRVASSEQRAAYDASALDAYVLGEERERHARRELIASRREPSLEQFLPRKGDGLALSASDIDLYRTCPLKYKFARVFAIPQEPTINQRFGILIHQVLERFHAEAMRAEAGAAAEPIVGPAPGTLERLLALFEAGWRRAGFAASDDELQYRDRAVAALARYQERFADSESRPVWLERSFNFSIGPHRLRGRVDRIDRLPGGDYELIDYKTGEPGSGPKLSGDVQIALYRMAARAAWEIEAELGSYWYVLADRRVEVAAAPDDAERVERTVLEVGAGISAQDFEPRPSYEICSWCDYRLICPASEA